MTERCGAPTKSGGLCKKTVWCTIHNPYIPPRPRCLATTTHGKPCQNMRSREVPNQPFCDRHRAPTDEERERVLRYLAAKQRLRQSRMNVA
jgi:hypothetical protein